jgi:hypothetical protein
VILYPSHRVSSILPIGLSIALDSDHSCHDGFFRDQTVGDFRADVIVKKGSDKVLTQLKAL